MRDKVQAWLTDKPGRAIQISYIPQRGFRVMAIEGDGKVTGEGEDADPATAAVKMATKLLFLPKW